MENNSLEAGKEPATPSTRTLRAAQGDGQSCVRKPFACCYRDAGQCGHDQATSTDSPKVCTCLCHHHNGPLSKPEADAIQLYRALENLYGDLYLVGLAEISLEAVYEGSARDAIKILKELQRWRRESVELAIGQKPAALAAVTHNNEGNKTNE